MTLPIPSNPATIEVSMAREAVPVTAIEREVIKPPKGSTAQDLLDWVLADPQRTRNQRKNAAAAIRWLGKVDSTPLAAIPLEARYLVDNRIRRLREHNSLTKARRSNIVTLLNQTLQRVGILKVGARRGGTTSHDWTTLVEALPGLSARLSLSSLAKFCSKREIAPRQVTLETWQAYQDETLYHSAFKNPRLAVQRTVKTSNTAKGLIADWPLPQLPGLPNPRAISIEKDRLPASFWLDLDTYTSMSSSPPQNMFDTTWPRQLSPATLQRYREVAWRTSSAQVHAGRDAAEIISLAALLDLVWLQRAMSWFYRHAGNRFLKDHLNMAATWVSFAENYVRLPADTVGQIRLGIKKMIERKLGPVGFSQKNVARLEQFSNDAVVEDLMLLPYRIMVEIKGKNSITVDDAVEMMAAVGIELLLTTMMRIKNLADIDLAKCLWPAEPTPSGSWSLSIESGDVKNGQPLRFALARPTIGLIGFYLDGCRPLLVKEPTDMMFLRTDGTPKGRAMLAHLISRTLRRRLGLEVNVHLFRHLGTMLYLRAHPGHFGVPQTMLGHRSDRTTQRFYARLGAAQANRQFSDAVLSIRNNWFARPASRA